MGRRTLLLAALVIALSLSGCAVLTIDVDVYKGALANHETVQTEQVAAMAMGAKPLLAELRYKLERAECDKHKKEASDGVEAGKIPHKRAKCPESEEQTASTANFIPLELLTSRDAQRVSQILSLYEDSTGQLLRSLGEAAERLMARYEEGKRTVGSYLFDPKGNPWPNANNCADLLAKRVRKSPDNGATCDRKPTESQIAAVRSVWEAAEDTWQEALRVLSSGEIRKRLTELREDVIWDVAWIAAEFTSGEGLRRLLTDETRPEVLNTGPLKELKKLLTVLQHPTNELTPADKDAVEAVLAEMLADDKTGPQLATQLAFAQGYAASKPRREWFIVIYPSKDLSDPKAIFLGDLKALLDRHRLGIALGAGRPYKGLENLIDEYLKASRENYESRATREARRRLLDALINFAEKVTIIANFDPLVRDPESLFEWLVKRNPFRSSDRDKYVQVLQAVGNSILSQVDALRQAEAHRGDLTRARETEVEGIRNAEARAAAVLKEITAELTAKPASFPDKAQILPLLKGGQTKMNELLNQLGITLTAQRKQLAEETEKTATDTAAIVADLERWHQQVATISSGGKPGITIPKRVEKDGEISKDGQKPTAKDVLDVMLATLRYEHINAMRDHGPDNQITRNLAAAVELNFAYRSGMVHIRPASVYLRNSYPASILQQDPTAGVWRNMLTDHAWHQVPFYGLFQQWWHKNKLEINNTIDKQFWQSVNQVRVSGVGLTNYAIAKDDVGNWYVKSYSSDPKDIIQSAKNLAMFSAGSAMGANFLARGGQPAGKSVVSEGATEAPTTKEARSTLAKQLDRSTERYTEATKKARDKLKTEVDGLGARLRSAAADNGVSEDDLKKMDAAKVFTLSKNPPVEELAKDRDAKNNLKGASELNKDIAAALLAVKQYRHEALARIASAGVAKEPTSGADVKAKQAIDGVVKDLLERYMKERQTATAQYESALLLIGESAGL